MKKGYGLLAAAALLACLAGCEDYNTYEGYESNGIDAEEVTEEATETTTSAATTTKATTTSAVTTTASGTTDTGAAEAENVTSPASDYLRSGTLEDQCREMKTKLEKAHKEFKEKKNDFSDKEEAYMRVNGVTDEEMSRIQSLIYDGKSGDILYFVLSDNYTPMADIDSGEDKYAMKGDEAENTTDISKLIDIKSYTQDFDSGFSVYTGADKSYSYYEISADMDADKLLKIVNSNSGVYSTLEKTIDKLDDADVYRLNSYDPVLYISRALKKGSKAR